jgi:acetolactate synthase small subunit
MQAFHIRYRNTQGTLMRILNAASRRGLDIPFVQAEPMEHTHQVTLLLEVNPRQAGQLYRDWNAVVDVIQVRAGVPLREQAWSAGIPPVPVTETVRANAARA